METVVNPDPSFWNERRVFLTGHTGFKGSWLALWLHRMGAEVTGYALRPPTEPNLFTQAQVADGMRSIIADVRDPQTLTDALTAAQPEVVFHLAAQPLVRESYRIPRETYEINVMGTVNLLDAVRACPTVRSVIIVTTDKVYENREWPWGYRETDRLGGYDPYSNSKAAAELAVAAYRTSYFHPDRYGTDHSVALCTVRAGNVIGGGDWALDRLVPDMMRARYGGTPLEIRNPGAVRPWQHVLEPLSGYLILAERAHASAAYAEGWNFGPRDIDCVPVATVAAVMGIETPVSAQHTRTLHEATLLKLDISKAYHRLGWRPRWDVARAAAQTLQEYDALEQGTFHADDSIDAYLEAK